jgi:hypothetical protein
MLPNALKEAQSHLVQAAAALGPHVVRDDHINGNVLCALESIDRAIGSVVLSAPPTLQPYYNSKPLEDVMRVWAKS